MEGLSSLLSLSDVETDSGSPASSVTDCTSAALTVILSCPNVVATRTKTSKNAQNLCNDFAFFILLSPLFLNNSELKPLNFLTAFTFFFIQSAVDKLYQFQGAPEMLCNSPLRPGYGALPCGILSAGYPDNKGSFVSYQIFTILLIPHCFASLSAPV